MELGIFDEGVGMRGRHPKPADMRQNRTKKAGIATLTAPESPKVVEIPNPDGRVWHPLTVVAWERAWASPMSTQWLDTDVDALGRLAVLWDEFNKEPDTKTIAEIRLQEQRFGFSPLDRSRLQWEVARADEAERRRSKPEAPKTTGDPRKFLKVV
jgi:hypothetical protein